MKPVAAPLVPHPPLRDYYGGEGERRGYVGNLFDVTARHYDWINRVMSFGSGIWYRRQALRRIGLAPGAAVLDVCIGSAQVARPALELVGPYVDVVRVADDLGTELGPIISPELYRALIKPRQKKLYGLIKSKTGARLLLHSCGAVRDLIGDFIDIGVDALNPVQVSARGMDSRSLKKEFGKQMCFWGGGCDTQRVLPFGGIEDIRREVRRRVSDLAPGGGFVFAPVHNIQFDVTPERIEALYAASREYGSYPIG